MSKLTRFFHKIFGINADFNYQMGKFGSFKNGSPAYAANLSDIQSLPNFEEGLYGAVVGNGAPFIQDVNGALHHSSRQIGYILQQGIPEWDSQTTYYLNGFCSHSGIIYKSLSDSNTNQTPSNSSIYWQAQTGTIGTFKNPLPFIWAPYESTIRAFAFSGLAVKNNFVYIVGGIEGATFKQQVYRYKLATDGSIEAEYLENELMPSVIAYNECIVHKNRIYSFGGATAAGGLGTNKVMFATINSDGTLGAWVNSTNPLYKAVRSATAVIIENALAGDKVYLIGGIDSAGALTNEIQVATLNSDGTIGAWTHYGALPTTEEGRAVKVGNFIYFLGSKIQRCHIASDATLTAFADLGSIGGTALSQFEIATIGNNVLLFGINGASAYVKMATLLDNSTLGIFQEKSLTGCTATMLGCVVAANGVLYTGFGSPAILATTYSDSFSTKTTPESGKVRVGYSDEGLVSRETFFQTKHFSPWKIKE